LDYARTGDAIVVVGIDRWAAMPQRSNTTKTRGTVADVSTRECFGLLCTRDDAVRYVEVKGTTQAPKGVFLNAHEVSHAKAHVGTVALFILSGISIIQEDGVPVPEWWNENSAGPVVARP
jgi:hypothetical protein